MRRCIAIAVMFFAPMASVATAGVNINVNIGAPVVAVPVAPPSLPEPQVVLDVSPRFIMSPALGFYVAVGIPYDIVYIGRIYYLNSNGHWYKAPYYNGPWMPTGPKGLPPGLHRHSYQEIRNYRDAEYRRFEHDRTHYRGHWHEPPRHDEGRR